MKAKKVPVRLGWRTNKDGVPGRVPRRTGDGTAIPGRYVGMDVVESHDVKGNLLSVEWVPNGKPEDVPDCQANRKAIMAGHLMVNDPEHELKGLEPDAPDDLPAWFVPADGEADSPVDDKPAPKQKAKGRSKD